jgi:hypothetical protein
MGKKQIGRDPDPSDPRSIEHPSHREQWLALARALGRLDARRDFEILHGKGGSIDEVKARSSKPDT